VMRVVLGWVASCHELPIDRLDDMCLAVETILAEESDEGADLILDLTVEKESLRILLAGLENKGLKGALLATRSSATCGRPPLDVRLLLGALVERFEVIHSKGAHFGVQMHARIP
jgi:hypothetical protein